MKLEDEGKPESFLQNVLARRDFIKASLAGAAAATLAGSAVDNALGLSSSSVTQRPNILYIHSHDTGRFMSPYGYDAPTPNLQKLADEGVLFRQAYCAAPTCSPSRASLLSGESPHNNGMVGLVNRGFSMSD